MNKLVAFAFVLMTGLTSIGQEDPIIIKIDDNEITKSEFLQIYLKNNNDPKYDKASLDEYIELFERFKLKVAEAEDLGYDTIPKLKRELEGYRKQLALPYLVDSAKNEALVKEAYDRTKTEIRASHILIKLPPVASPNDTLNAYNILMDAKKRIENGADFATVAMSKRGSEDPSVRDNGGDLGYFTAFQMVYPFEDVAYKTKVGEVSNPFRTKFGMHILKVTDKRAARGTIQTAHIMVAANKTSKEEEIKAAEQKILEIYNQLENGESFEDLVAKHSDDPSSNKKGGVLAEFGTGSTTRMVPEFEEAAFQLKNDGDYSKPIRTAYGFHIIKRLSWQDVPAFESMKKTLENKVAKDERSKTTQDSFVEKLKAEYKYKSKTKGGLKWFKKNLDSTYFLGKFEANSLKGNKALFKMDKQKFGQQSFAEYLEKNYRGIRKAAINSTIDHQYRRWEKETILNYEESKLESKYPAYKALITEYHDGILLYEIMSDKVWNKAMKDTVGLKKFFEANKSNYKWGNRIDADIYECYNSENANKVVQLLKNDTITPNQIVDNIGNDSKLNIRHRANKFDIDKTSYLKGREFSKGVNNPFEVNGKFYVVNVKEKLAPSQKEFSESKGAATSDYQNFLENEWIKELKNKHTVTINKDQLYSIGK